MQKSSKINAKESYMISYLSLVSEQSKRTLKGFNYHNYRADWLKRAFHGKKPDIGELRRLRLNRIFVSLSETCHKRRIENSAISWNLNPRPITRIVGNADRISRS